MSTPAWIPCPCCEEFVCTLHDMHAFECPCPPIEEWGDVDPYSAGGKEPGPDRNTRGPCAKTRVFCTIEAINGQQFVGENDCETPQEKCPRAPGEDYAKCASVCNQRGHAEQNALMLAGAHARGATAVIRGHSYACRECQEAMFAAGIRWLGVHNK